MFGGRESRYVCEQVKCVCVLAGKVCLWTGKVGMFGSR